MSSTDTMFIVGAGFSRNAGLPLTTEFTKQLLDTGQMEDTAPSAILAKFITKFVSDSFGHVNGTPDDWPALEDIFTCIDLSANTGHHLGPTYSPSVLRTVRRALIVRTIRMLVQAYERGKKQPNTSSTDLNLFFSHLPVQRCAFLSMNWDAVIEQRLAHTQSIRSFDYCCSAEAAWFERADIRVHHPASPTAIVLKPHGSINWLYCDNCRSLYWFHPRGSLRIANLLFRRRDWRVVDQLIGQKSQRVVSRACPQCGASSLGTRFATFSYRKALDFPMHAQTWAAAERLLHNAKNWVFIGYSLPAADYEFKHLLKRVQLSRIRKPRIILVTAGAGAVGTVENYSRFFGSRFKRERATLFTNGLDDNCRRAFQAMGILRE